MREYFEWRQDDGAPNVRIHRRVLAGLERERPGEFGGVLLGTISEDRRELVVEDYTLLPPGGVFDPKDVAAVGYFRAVPDDEARISEEERAMFAARFAGSTRVLLLFQLGPDAVRLADAFVSSPRGTREPEAPRTGEPAPTHRGLFRAAPQAAGPPAAAPPAGELPEPAESAAGGAWHRFVLPLLAIVTGFAIGGAAYLATRGELPRDASKVSHSGDAARPAAPVTAPPPAGETPVPPPVAQAPITPSSGRTGATAEADRAIDPGKPASAALRAQVQREIRDLLSEWRESLLNEDVTAHANLYASTVGPYFRKSHATRAEIAGEVRRMLKQYGSLTTYKISDVTIAPVDENHAIANFRKQWKTASNRFSGEEREQLKFARHGDRWVITSEQELKVYWVRRK